MKLVFVGIVGLLFSAVAAAQGGPEADQVAIRTAEVQGTRCPSEGVSFALIEETAAFAGPVRYLQVTYNDYSVKKPGKSRIKCKFALDLVLPEGWAFGITEASTSGYGEINAGIHANFKIAYSFGGRKRATSRIRQGASKGDFTVANAFATPLFSDCLQQKPLSIEASITLVGRAMEGEVSTVGGTKQSGLITQLYRLAWQKC